MRDWAKRILGYDTETTGLDEDARIVEFGAVLIEDKKVVTSWQVLLNPPGVDWHNPSVQEALECNGLTRKDLEGKKTFAQEFAYIKSALTQADVRVGHNVKFDSNMLRQEFRRAVAEGTLSKDALGGASGIVTLDTLALDLYLNPNASGHKLEQVAARWGVYNWQKHRAIGDADASIRILTAMSDHLPEDINVVFEISKEYQERNRKWWEEHRAIKARRDSGAVLTDEQKQLLLLGEPNEKT